MNSRFLAAASFAAVSGATLPADAASQHALIFGFTSASQGAMPEGGVIGDKAGNLYGTTALGGPACSFNGPAGCGLVYELSPPAQPGSLYTQTILFSFPHYAANGAEPLGGVIADSAGNLYGTTLAGGHYGLGTVFRLSPPGGGGTSWAYTRLYSFSGTTDGANPEAGLVADATGALYGTTFDGNGNTGCGTVFRLTPPAAGKSAWAETTLYTFKGNGDGCQPQANLIADASGALYGTTTGAGKSSPPTVFRLAPGGAGYAVWTETTLHIFGPGAGGAGPAGGLAAGANGILYGMASTGGASACSLGCGTVYALTPPVGNGAWTYNVIYGFTGLVAGRHPVGHPALDSAGNLYGATSGRTATPGGTVFELSPPQAGTTWIENTLYHFTNGTQGAQPNAGVWLDSQNNVVGTMVKGAPGGAVFKVAP